MRPVNTMRTTLMLSSHLRLGLPNGLFPMELSKCIRIDLEEELKAILQQKKTPQYTQPIFEARSPRHRQSSPLRE
uniref:Uncharacterized protein n=1 Tax=Timema poppense TaxID=170557 RepID=A0A7R9GVX2_TIMPO|nr:unnamed protein product [Timema poppensis]